VGRGPLYSRRVGSDDLLDCLPQILLQIVGVFNADDLQEDLRQAIQ
jgi:hypothetical protein